MWRTEIPATRSSTPLDHRSNIFLIGSCFSENLGQKLVNAGFHTCQNPFGILFNPVSIASNLERLVHNNLFTSEDLVEFDGMFHSFCHHGSYSGNDPDETLRRINDEFAAARTQLLGCSRLFITLGSAWTYIYKARQVAVANCHRIPQKEFDKVLVSSEAIVNDYLTLFDLVIGLNPDVEITLTVSPVRHWKDGAVNNQRSKSELHVAAHKLCDRFDQVEYYPSYELVMDDLRDYRFYKEDMLHPTSVAVDYIWNHFKQTYFSEETSLLVGQIEKKSRALGHRYKDPEEGRQVAQRVRKEIDELIEAAYS